MMSIEHMADNKITSLYSGPVAVIKPSTTTSPVLPTPVIEPTSEQSLRMEAAKTDENASVYQKDKELEQKLHEVTETLQTHFDVNNKKLNFSVHGDSGRMIVKVIDPESGETLKELPSEAVLKMVANIEKFQDDISNSTGLLLDEIV
ncbi:MAG: flagellar protein FlaG [Moritella sp.]|jgi:flagellar protein FlaG